MNGKYRQYLPPMSVTHLSRVESDHCPLLMELLVTQKPKASFKFHRMWLDHADFQNFVANQWQRPVIGSPMFVLHKKLIYLSRELKEWNWNVFNHLQRRMEQQQEVICDVINQQLKHASEYRHQLLVWDAELLQQKSRVKWLTEGYKISFFFHATLKEQRHYQNLKIKREVGSWCNSGQEVGEAAVEYFSKIFSSEDHQLNENLFYGIPATVSNRENCFFKQIPSEAEIWEAIKSLDPCSAPGNDGLTG